MAQQLTPTLVLSLSDASSEGAWGNVSVGSVSTVGGLADDKLAEWHAGCSNLEESSVGEDVAGLVEEAVAGGVFVLALCERVSYTGQVYSTIYLTVVELDVVTVDEGADVLVDGGV